MISRSALAAAAGGSARLEHQAREAAHVARVHALDAVLGHVVLAPAAEELLERHARLHAREEGAQTHVAPVAEAEVELDLALQIEAIRIREAAFIAAASRR